jgi:DNA-directed RNA polymerase specialized sigma24 family protein
MAKKMGRPRIEIDRKQFEGLCGIMCTLEEIASVFGCSEDTIERWCKREYEETFAEVYKKYSAKGRTSIRRWQFKHAQKNVTMAIWLGKQYLGQRDSFEYHDDEAISKLDEVLSAVKAEANDEAIPEAE